MSGYIRFVSYIYTYEQELKGKNVGFAKVEIRNGRQKIAVNIRGLYGFEEIPLHVYGLFRCSIRDKAEEKAPLAVASVYASRSKDQAAASSEGCCVGVLLGELRLKTGMGDMCYICEREVLPENGNFRFQDMCGLLIRTEQNRYRCCGTIWDDLPFSPAQFMTDTAYETLYQREATVKPEKMVQTETEAKRLMDDAKTAWKEEVVRREQEMKRQRSLQEQIQDAEENVSEATYTGKTNLPEAEEEGLSQDATGQRQVEGIERKKLPPAVDAPMEDTRKWEIVLTPKEEIEYINTDEGAGENPQKEIAGQQADMPVSGEAVVEKETGDISEQAIAADRMGSAKEQAIAEDRMGSAKEQAVAEDRMGNTKEQAIAAEAKAGNTAHEEKQYANKVSAEAAGARGQQEYGSENMPTSKNCAGCPKANREPPRRQQQHKQPAPFFPRVCEGEDAWNQFLKVYHEIYPFGRNTRMRCISIRPGDIGRLPREYWILGNNSFLLHGFYQFRHLILLRKQEQDEVLYYLGVPGQNHSNEKFMAEMFGFSTFLPAETKRRDSPVFGYWCAQVGLGGR